MDNMRPCLKYFALAAIFGFAGSPAIAQPGSANPGSEERVVVTAPYYTVKESRIVGRRGGTLNPMVISLSRDVSYADIDLATGAGAAELEKRVGTAARDVCAELDRRYPEARYPRVEKEDCVKTAADDAMVVVKHVVAAAGR